MLTDFNPAFLLTVGAFLAYRGKVFLIRALRDCKQRSLTVSKKTPTVSKKASPTQKIFPSRSLLEGVANLQFGGRTNISLGVLYRKGGGELLFICAPHLRLLFLDITSRDKKELQKPRETIFTLVLSGVFGGALKIASISEKYFLRQTMA